MRFRVPVYIAQSASSYAARPLFFANPVRHDENLNRLLTKLSGDLVRSIEFTARNDRQDDAAKWAFAPTVTQHRLQIAINLRRRTVKGRFLFVSFRHLGRRLAFTPSLPDLWFEIARGERLEARAEAVFEEHWRQVERDADDPDQVDPGGQRSQGEGLGPGDRSFRADSGGAEAAAEVLLSVARAAANRGRRQRTAPGGPLSRLALSR